MFKQYWPNAPRRVLRGIDTVLTSVEGFVVSVPEDFPEGRTGRNFAAIQIDDVAEFSSFSDETPAPASVRTAIGILNKVTRVTYFSVQCEHADETHLDYRAAKSRIATSLAEITTEMADIVPCIDELHRDFDLLKAVSEREGWTDQTSVPAEFFGPLWSAGAPADWPRGDGEQDTSEFSLRLHFSIPAEMGRDEADEIICKILLAANELHLVYGGSGLKVADKVKVYESARIVAEGDR